MVIASGLASKQVSLELLKMGAVTHALIQHSQTAMLVLSGNLPVTMDPDVAIVVRSANCIGSADGDKLANEALPKVQTIRLGLELGVDL